MKKTYISPEADLLEFEVKDVIAASLGNGTNANDDDGWGWVDDDLNP